MRRRYEVRFEEKTRRYLVEVVEEGGNRRYIESYADWESADSLRTHANSRLEATGDLLAERR